VEMLLPTIDVAGAPNAGVARTGAGMNRWAMRSAHITRSDDANYTTQQVLSHTGALHVYHGA
jgi:hypothetical protein